MTVTIHTGDCRDVMRTLPEKSVHTCISSPPYFGLRDYGVDGQIGLEAKPDCLGWATGERCGACFVCTLVDVYREVRRVLRDDGTCWVNLGDSYAGSGRGGNPTIDSSTLQGSNVSQEASRVKRTRDDVSHSQRLRCPAVKGSRLPPGLHTTYFDAGAIGRAWVPPPAGFKQKDLMGMPWRVALALQADGWYLRQDIIWSKPNPMPESVRDRCTKAHEYVFLLAKSEKYYFDATAITERATYGRTSTGVGFGHGFDKEPKPRVAVPSGWDTRKGSHRDLTGRFERPSQAKGSFNGKTGDKAFRKTGETRNKRSVWTIPAAPYAEAHFATYPPALIEPCMLAGCPVGGIVLDPFGGSGTTGEVAERLGRDSWLIELNPEYVELARRRTQQMGLQLGTTA